MLDSDTKRRINACRDILVGKVFDPKSFLRTPTEVDATASVNRCEALGTGITLARLTGESLPDLQARAERFHPDVRAWCFGTISITG
jgi:hypothetical protein